VESFSLVRIDGGLGGPYVSSVYNVSWGMAGGGVPGSRKGLISL
jgi:hypothetical protein